MCEKTIAFSSRQKDVRPSGWQCRPDAHNHGYYILNTILYLITLAVVVVPLL